MEQLTDESLREQLKAFGKDVGPLNNSTRPYWKKALDKLLSNHSDSPIERVSDNKIKEKSQQCHRGRNEILHSTVDDDYSFSVKDFSTADSEDSFLTDSPGHTPLPAKMRRKLKTSPSKKRLYNSGTPDSGNKNRNGNHTSGKYRYPTNNPKKNCLNRKPTQIQYRDKELREKLMSYGVYMDRGPLNDATRNMWQRKLHRLIISEVSPVSHYSEIESPPYQNINQSGCDDDSESIDYGFSVENPSTEMDLHRNIPILRRNGIRRRKSYQKMYDEKYQGGAVYVKENKHGLIHYFSRLWSVFSLILRWVAYVLAFIALHFTFIAVIIFLHKKFLENDDENLEIEMVSIAKENPM